MRMGSAEPLPAIRMPARDGRSAHVDGPRFGLLAMFARAYDLDAQLRAAATIHALGDDRSAGTKVSLARAQVHAFLARPPIITDRLGAGSHLAVQRTAPV